MVKPLYIAIGAAALGAAWWWFKVRQPAAGTSNQPLPVSTVLPNSTGGTVTVSPGIVVPAGDKNPYAGNPMFDPVVQAYSSEFAWHNSAGDGMVWVQRVGGLEGYRAGNR